MIWKSFSHCRNVTATAYCICLQSKNPQVGWATVRDVLSMRWVTTQRWPGELLSSLGLKGNQRSLSCTAVGPLKLCDMNPNMSTWGTSVSSTACVPQPNKQHRYTPDLFLNIYTDLHSIHSHISFFPSPLSFGGTGFNIFLDWSL